MADTKISALTAASTPLAGTEVLPIVQSGATVKVSVANLTAGRAVAAASLSAGSTTTPASSRTLGFGALTTATGGIQIYQVGSNTDWAINSSSGSIANFYSDSGSALVYAGTISVNGIVTTYGSVSDYRLKENVQPMTDALEKVQALNPVTFTFKNGGQVSQGFIAHELQAVIPDAVTGEKDALKEDGSPNYQSVDTSFLVATLTAAIKELNATVVAQSEAIAALQAKVGT
jgi:hypothetical protein